MERSSKRSYPMKNRLNKSQRAKIKRIKCIKMITRASVRSPKWLKIKTNSLRRGPPRSRRTLKRNSNKRKRSRSVSPKFAQR